MLFNDIVDNLVISYREHESIIKLENRVRLNRNLIHEAVEILFCLIFPGYFGKKEVRRETLEYYAGDMLERVRFILESQIGAALEHSAADKSGDIVFDFLSSLPEIRASLATDKKSRRRAAGI